jgi:hypothetical protein
MESQKGSAQVELVVVAFAQRTPTKEVFVLKDLVAQEIAREGAVPCQAWGVDEDGNDVPIESSAGMSKREEVSARVIVVLAAAGFDYAICAKAAWDYADAWVMEGLKRKREEDFPHN